MQFKTPITLLSVLLLTSLSSCATNTTGTVRTVHDFCLIAKGLTFSEKHGDQMEDMSNKYDTDETVQQIKNHDLAYEATCPQAKTGNK